MPASTVGGFFLVIAGLELAVLNKKVFPLDGFRTTLPLLSTPMCFEQPGFTHYPVGGYLDQMNCLLNSIFQAAQESRDAQLLMGSFVPVLLAGLMIATYESFRPAHRSGLLGAVARNSSLFFLWGQRMTAGFAMPVHAAFCAWSRVASGPKKRKSPNGRHAWSTLLSVIGGFVLPTLYLAKEKFAYPALSAWQIFPLYILALNLVLPRILPNAPRTSAVAIIAVVCTVVSVSSHIELIRETMDGRRLGDIFLWNAVAMPTLSYAAHALFLIDYVAVIVTVATIVLLNFKAKVGVLIAMLVTAVAAGPGAALILPWAYHEMSTK